MKSKGTIRLETDRLILRRHALSDAEDMFNNWVTDPEVCKYWQWQPHRSIDETRAILAEYVKNYISPDYYLWAIEQKTSNTAIGYIYLTDIGDSSCSVHYALGRAFWNKGYMTEACSRVIEFALAEMSADTVFSYCHIDNIASARVLEKSGMRLTKTEYRDIPECERISGYYNYYEKTKEDNDMTRDEKEIIEVLESYKECVSTQNREKFIDLWSRREICRMISVGTVFTGAMSIADDFLIGAIQKHYSKIELVAEETDVNTVSDKMAIVVFKYHTECILRDSGEPHGIRGVETQLLTKEDGKWKLCHIHYSKV